MIIAISGLSGSGKNAVGELAARKLGLRVVSFTFKSKAKESGVSLMEFQKKANADRKIDIDFDRLIAKEASKGNCVVTTWLGPWVVKDADVRVWLRVPREVRAKRVAKRDNMSVKEALRHIDLRDNDNRKRYRKLYDIDIDNHEDFDIEIKADTLLPAQLVNIVAVAAREKSKARLQ